MFSQSTATDLIPITLSPKELASLLQPILHSAVNDLRRVHVDVSVLQPEGPSKLMHSLNSLEELAQLPSIAYNEGTILDVYAWKSSENDVFLTITLKAHTAALDVQVSSYDTLCESSVLKRLLETFPPKPSTDYIAFIPDPTPEPEPELESEPQEVPAPIPQAPAEPVVVTHEVVKEVEVVREVVREKIVRVRDKPSPYRGVGLVILILFIFVAWLIWSHNKKPAQTPTAPTAPQAHPINSLEAPVDGTTPAKEPLIPEPSDQ